MLPDENQHSPKRGHLNAKDTSQRCTFVIIADGFEEIRVMVFVSLLRQAGLCVKSVSLTSGLVSGAHGVWVMPDLTLADLDQLTNTTTVQAVILPEEGPTLARLEADPRMHKLLRQVVAQRGQIVTNREGLRILRMAAVWSDAPGDACDPTTSIILREPGQPSEAIVQDIIRRLVQLPRA